MHTGSLLYILPYAIALIADQYGMVTTPFLLDHFGASTTSTSGPSKESRFLRVVGGTPLQKMPPSSLSFPPFSSFLVLVLRILTPFIANIIKHAMPR